MPSSGNQEEVLQHISITAGTPHTLKAHRPFFTSKRDLPSDGLLLPLLRLGNSTVIVTRLLVFVLAVVLCRSLPHDHCRSTFHRHCGVARSMRNRVSTRRGITPPRRTACIAEGPLIARRRVQAVFPPEILFAFCTMAAQSIRGRHMVLWRGNRRLQFASWSSFEPPERVYGRIHSDIASLISRCSSSLKIPITTAPSSGGSVASPSVG